MIEMRGEVQISESRPRAAARWRRRHEQPTDVAVEDAEQPQPAEVHPPSRVALTRATPSRSSTDRQRTQHRARPGADPGRHDPCSASTARSAASAGSRAARSRPRRRAPRAASRAARAVRSALRAAGTSGRSRPRRSGSATGSAPGSPRPGQVPALQGAPQLGAGHVLQRIFSERRAEQRVEAAAHADVATARPGGRGSAVRPGVDGDELLVDLVGQALGEQLLVLLACSPGMLTTTSRTRSRPEARGQEEVAHAESGAARRQVCSPGPPRRGGTRASASPRAAPPRSPGTRSRPPAERDPTPGSSSRSGLKPAAHMAVHSLSAASRRKVATSASRKPSG